MKRPLFIITDKSFPGGTFKKSAFPFSAPGQTGNARWMVLLALLALCAVLLGFLVKKHFIPESSQKVTEQNIPQVTAAPSPQDVHVSKPVQLQPITGWVTVQDRWGNNLSKTRTAVIGGAWLALPVRACLGGETWIFTADNGKKTSVEGGFWAKGDELGLWHLAGAANGQFDIPSIPSWDPKKEMQWLPLAAGGQPQAVTVTPVKKLNYFMQCSVPVATNEPGLFIQGNKVVGWSFGDQLPGGYLWEVPDLKVLENAWVWVDDFYSITFAHGREEYFAKALAIKNLPYTELLQIFAEGLRLKPKLAKEDTPARLSSDAILDHMRFLVAKILETGTYKEIADIFYDPFFIGLADTSHLTDAIWMTASTYGYESAIKLTEKALASRRNSEDEQSAFAGTHRQLYLEWLGILRDGGDMKKAWQVYSSAKEYYPYDPEIHLVGVELALAENDWQEAERLLAAMQYPPELENKIRTLQSIISKLKGQAGKIIIHFTPGHNIIPAKALINDRIEQQFVIDTGASMVTIPASTADYLGIEIDAQTPTQQIHTAGGVKIAPVVTLSAIELEGWVVHDVKAVVLDIPNQPQLGLLGLNFLNKFRMNIDSGRGVLLLEPR